MKSMDTQSSYLQTHFKQPVAGTLCGSGGGKFQAGETSLVTTLYSGSLKGSHQNRITQHKPGAFLRLCKVDLADAAGLECALSGACLDKGSVIVRLPLEAQPQSLVQPAAKARPQRRAATASSGQEGASGVVASLEAAAPMLRQAVESADDFQAAQLAGLVCLDKDSRSQVLGALGAQPSDVSAFNKRHPPPRAAAGRATRSTRASAAATAASEAAAGAPEPAAPAASAAEPAAAAASAANQQQAEVPTRASKRQRTAAAAALAAAEDAEAGASVAAQGDPATAAPAAPAAPAAASDDSGEQLEGADGLTEYERQRLAQMARNRARLQALHLPTLAAQVAPQVVKPRETRGVGPKRARASPAPDAPRRQSLRVRGLAADAALAAGVDEETARGGVVLAGGAAAAAAAGAAAAAKPKERHPKGPLPLTSDNCSEAASDASFLELLRRLAPVGDHAAATSAKAAGRSPRKGAHVAHHGEVSDGALALGPVCAASAGKLKLQEADVVKMTKDGITHLEFHPTTARLLVAAGDKDGKVALWDVVAEEDDEGGGVRLYSPHYEYISGLKWLAGGSKLLTSSYDGSVRLLDVAAGEFVDLSAGIPPDMEISACEVDPAGSIAYIGDNLGNMEVLDLRVGRAMRSGFSAHDRRLNTIQLEPLNQRVILTSGSDGVVCTWDVRMLAPAAAAPGGAGGSNGHAAGRHQGGEHADDDEPLARRAGRVAGSSKAKKGWAGGGSGGKPLCVVHHGKSCHAAYWAPDGSQRVVSTSYDDTVRVWSLAGSSGHAALLEQALCIKHNNQTGRWVTPFRAVWGAAGDVVAVGSMARGVDVFDATSGKQLTSLHSEFMTAIPSRLAVHPQLQVLAAATSSGRVHLWR